MFLDLHKLLQLIKYGTNYHLKYIRVNNTKNNRIFLSLLYKKNLIFNYCFSNNLSKSFIIIELKYHNNKNCFLFKNLITRNLIKNKISRKISKYISFTGKDYLVYHNKYGLVFLSDLKIYFNQQFNGLLFIAEIIIQ